MRGIFGLKICSTKNNPSPLNSICIGWHRYLYIDAGLVIKQVSGCCIWLFWILLASGMTQPLRSVLALPANKYDRIREDYG